MTIEEKKKYVKVEIELDFPIPAFLLDLFQQAEAADGDWCVYEPLADAIDVQSKNLCAEGYFTKKQWEQVIQKYPYPYD